MGPPLWSESAWEVEEPCPKPDLTCYINLMERRCVHGSHSVDEDMARLIFRSVQILV